METARHMPGPEEELADGRFIALGCRAASAWKSVLQSPSPPFTRVLPVSGSVWVSQRSLTGTWYSGPTRSRHDRWSTWVVIQHLVLSPFM